MNNLSTYLKKLESYKYISPLTFSALFSEGVDLHQISDEFVAEKFSASKSLADRWRSGDTAPAYSYRLLVIKALKELTLEAISE